MTDLSTDRLRHAPELTGRLLETFVVGELRRLTEASSTRPTLHHFRTERGREVDAVLEDASGRVVGIEVKAGEHVGGGDLAGLQALADAAGDAFHLGLVLHPGHQAIAHGDRLWAVPASLLWT